MKHKPTQRLRVIINGIHVYTTARQIRAGVGDHVLINETLRHILETIEVDNVVGLGRRLNGYDVQLSLL